MRYADKHDDARPTSDIFSKMIQKQVRKRNHPNVFAGIVTPASNTQSRRQDETMRRSAPRSDSEIRGALKTDGTSHGDTLRLRHLRRLLERSTAYFTVERARISQSRRKNDVGNEFSKQDCISTVSRRVVRSAPAMKT